jgi:ABC-type spermidine/putrescine transport system permease subunit II
MRLRNKFTEWFWFILLILPLCVTFIYGFKNSSIGLEYGSLLTCLNSFLPFSNQLYNAFEGALSFLGVGSEFSVVLAYIIANAHTYIQNLKKDILLWLMIDFIVLK